MLNIINFDFFMLIDNLFNFNQSVIFVISKFISLVVKVQQTFNVEYKVVSSA